MVRLAYVLLSYLMAPFVIGYLIWRGFWNREYWDRFNERFGYSRINLPSPSIWVHAVSVGEVQAAASLIRALQDRFPETPVVITTVTPTGAQRAVDLFGDSVTHMYAPYDLPGAVNRFFDRAKPRLAIIIETELWPNLYHACGQRKVPLVLASARISPRSVSKYRWFLALFSEALSHGIVIAAQSESDAQRFKSLGANPARTHVTGNIKFDFELPPDIERDGAEFRELHASGRPVWVAASTHMNEEEKALDAHDLLRRELPDALLLLVPRHPERFAYVASLLSKRGYSYVTRSSGARCSDNIQVFLGNTLGELPVFYAASDIAFVGGSLVPVGGHNLLEPAVLGLPVITGPYTFNAEDIALLFNETGAAITVHNARELGEQLLALFRDPKKCAYRGEQGRKTVEENRGALGRLLALVEPLVENPLAHSHYIEASGSEISKE